MDGPLTIESIFKTHHLGLLCDDMCEVKEGLPPPTCFWFFINYVPLVKMVYNSSALRRRYCVLPPRVRCTRHEICMELSGILTRNAETHMLYRSTSVHAKHAWYAIQTTVPGMYVRRVNATHQDRLRVSGDKNVHSSILYPNV